MSVRSSLGVIVVALGLATAACAEREGSGEVVLDHLVLVAAAESEIGEAAFPAGSSPFGSYLAGLFAGKQRDLGAAADFMLEALTDAPDDEQLLNRTFLLVASDGRHDKAVELGRSLLQRDADHGLAALVVAVDAFERGAIEEAEAILGKLSRRGLSLISVPLLRAWLKVAGGDLDGALETASALADRSGFGVLHSLHVALMNDVQGQTAAARKAYEESLAEAGTPSLRLTWLVGNFLERNGDKARARELYEGILVDNPDSTLIAAALRRLETGPAPDPEVSDARGGIAETLFNLASLLSQERAEEVALVHAHLALRLKPDFVVARILLGEILQGQDRGEAAISMYRQIPADSELSWTVRLRIAEELERLDRADEAIAELESLAEARPDRYEPLLRLGNLLRVRERFEEAVAAYDRAEQRLASPTRRHWTLYYFRGIALERSSEWSRAERDFLRALELEPEQPLVMNYLAYSWVEQKTNLDQAKGMLVRAVELRPDDGYIVDSLGWVYYRLGEYDKGVQLLERAVELRPQDSVINDHLGDAYWRVGRHQEARFQWRRALSLGPEEPEVAKIENKIEHGLTDPPENI